MHTAQASCPHKIEKGMNFRNFQKKSQNIMKFDNTLILPWEICHNDSNYVSVVIAFPVNS